MDCRVSSTNGNTEVEFAGRLDAAVKQEQREQLMATARPGAHVHIDFSGLTDITGTGLRRLLNFSRYLRAQSADVSISGLAPQLWELIDAAGFVRLFREARSLSRAQIVAPQRVPINIYPSHYHEGFALRIGAPLPLGAYVVPRGINFSVYSHHATACSLVLFHADKREPFVEIPFPAQFRVGDVFSMLVFDLEFEDIEYCYRMEGPYAPERGHYFNRERLLLDPMARSITAGAWGQRRDEKNPLRARIIPDDFDWEEDAPLNLPAQELVVYEMHVRDFTAHPNSGVRHPGTFAGMRDKIAYLKELGVNCVEFLPIFEFDENEVARRDPWTGGRLFNHWGYSTVAFFAPKAGYAATCSAGMQSDELKALIKELHRNGIEVMLDVVFNHTAEGNEKGPTISLRGIDNKVYYLLSPNGQYLNFSGCGNTLNCNHPVVREFVVECLRYWVTEFHIDGFRFDLASILGRDQSGAPLSNPPLLEALAADPVLARTKLIAEAWDAGGLYQVGSFPAYGRWLEWNGRYRDCVRRFLKSDAGLATEVATRIIGSPDLYRSRGPAPSVNFITCHDGFTLADLVSYNQKHNDANGENNADGANDNDSWNSGVEGATTQPEILRLRMQRMKNALALLFLSQGVPMILMGDECGRTQRGNNNAYCHDGELVWFDWDQLRTNAELYRFCRMMIAYRKAHPILSNSELSMNNVSWHGTAAWHPDWSQFSRTLAFMLKESESVFIYAAMNMYWESLHFSPPQLPQNLRWHVSVNTAGRDSDDIFEVGKEQVLDAKQPVRVEARSIVVLRGRA
jgi:glycogen operon protein